MGSQQHQLCVPKSRGEEERKKSNASCVTADPNHGNSTLKSVNTKKCPESLLTLQFVNNSSIIPKTFISLPSSYP